MAKVKLRTEQLLDDTADILRHWLVGQLVVMLTIGVLSGIGLWALGIEAAFALGVVGGLLTFIPYVGAVLAAVPAILVALTQGPVQALSVVLMYMGVHFVEGISSRPSCRPKPPRCRRCSPCSRPLPPASCSGRSACCLRHLSPCS